MKQHKEAGPQRDVDEQVGGAGAAGKRTLTDQLDNVGASAATASAGLRVPAPKPRYALRKQNDKRGKDPAQPPGVGPPTGFSDMGKDDKGPTFHHDHGFLDDGHGNIDESKRQD